MNTYIVVGAGIVGVSTAYHLAKAGFKVTVVDRFDRGQATEAAAGIICPWLSQRRNKAWYELVKGGARFYPQLVEELAEVGQTDTGYKQVGAISLHKDKEKLEAMAERAMKRRDMAPEMGDVDVVSSAEVQRLFPPIHEDYGAVYVSGGARVNGKAMRESLKLAAQQYGAKFFTGNANLLFTRQRVVGVKVNNQEFHADQVIVTAGAWGQEVIQSLGVQFAIKPQKAQIIHLELQGVDTQEWPVVQPPNNQYMLAFGGGRVVIGATHEDEARFDARKTAGGVSEILHKALEIAPGLSNAEIVDIKVGFRPVAPGFLPVFGALPDWEGIYVANGLGASGLTSGPFLGAEIAKLVMGQQTQLNPSMYAVEGAIH
ncbi:FAD-binding oxidoreductase [Bacillus sp. HMF5848]|uniref:NAD(P)/FAD-dependent oxidoreductase n=1 Tax=Bacillus sp. HMF5848 TaxID=2495421 RepID=UPI000F7852C5|nr:FAD-binding oxidoreductase [Bacillus sp. HMF5848]RSK25955.1 FAD-binding oxidoreductase [Bacillus sp. HMF5848]